VIQLITQALAVLAGVTILLTALYKHYWSPKAKNRRQAAKDGKQAIDDKDPSKLTAKIDRINRNK